MKKILVIAGPTATGKTPLAVQVSKIIPSILISADSRQVYKHMGVVTGKDHPGEISLAGIDLLEPDQPFSVADWNRAILPALEQAKQDNLLPILVGGTGLYIKSVIEGIATLNIPPNSQLREALKKATVEELQEKVKELNLDHFTQMNNSDQNNPRRLIRALEILSSPSLSRSPPDFEPLFICLKLPLDKLEERIHARVLARLADNRAVKETQYLLDNYNLSSHALSSLGYQPIIEFIKGQITASELTKQWTQSEFAYAKRQLTWFKKQAGVNWFDADLPDLASQVVKQVKTWYYEK